MHLHLIPETALYAKDGKCDAVQRANTHKAPLYIAPYTCPIPLHLVLGAVNTHREWKNQLCKMADKISPGGAVEDVERTIDGLQEEIEAAEEDANEEREMSGPGGTGDDGADIDWGRS